MLYRGETCEITAMQNAADSSAAKMKRASITRSNTIIEKKQLRPTIQ
jgi:hypothetical protein